MNNNFNESNKVLVGYPSKSALEIMLKNLGFSYNFFDWHKQEISNWSYLQDYYKNERITLFVKIIHNKDIFKYK